MKLTSLLAGTARAALGKEADLWLGSERHAQGAPVTGCWRYRRRLKLLHLIRATLSWGQLGDKRVSLVASPVLGHIFLVETKSSGDVSNVADSPATPVLDNMPDY